MANLHMEALAGEELAEVIDQGLASLRLREWPPEVAVLIERACDAWDEVADAIPGFRT